MKFHLECCTAERLKLPHTPSEPPGVPNSEVCSWSGFSEEDLELFLKPVREFADSRRQVLYSLPRPAGCLPTELD